MRGLDQQSLLGRRALLAGAAAGLAWPVLRVRPVAATPASAKAAMDEILKGRVPTPGRVKLDIPVLADNGNSVPMSVRVASPMTASDRVRSIHVFADGNPLPVVGHFHLGPRAAKAEIATRIRLATTQTVVALAVMADRSVWSDALRVEIVLSACLDD